MKPITVEYCKGSNSIRQMPQNYLLAYRTGDRWTGGRWICDTDPAADENIAVALFKLVLKSHDHRYGTGEHLVEGLREALSKE